jgi:acetyl-CoA synthetase
MDIDSVLLEKRSFPPSPAFAAQAHIKSEAEYQKLCAHAERDPEGYWAEQAGALRWSKKWSQVLEWKPPHARWFIGGELNASDNCLDRHLAERGDKLAIIFEGEPGDKRTLTYKELHAETCRLAAGLASLGVKKGDRVAIYLPMIPEAVIAMLACARLGAPHTVIFGGFSSEALRDRINDAQASVVITADGSYRRGQVVPLKENVDGAVKDTPSVKHVIVVERTKEKVAKTARDVSYAALVKDKDARYPAVAVDAEHPLFILYTSGTTGKPKGVVHTTGGYLANCALTTRWVFDLKDEDIFWCTADVGWATGHSYVVYGPLACGATLMMYEGAPAHPQPDRFWELIARYKVSIFYTAPTAIRAFIKQGDAWPKKHDLSSLRVLGSVGEPINPEAWMWYHRVIGGERCPIVDTWWQTETGAIMCSPLPGVTATKPGSCTRPLPGVALDIVDDKGASVPEGKGGNVVIKRPWPSMLRTIYGDDKRFAETYFSQYPGVYFAGDTARRDADGYFWMMGRNDDVVKVSGHRLGTAEIESALVSHAGVAEAAVVDKPDEVRGSALVVFVTLKQGNAPSAALKDELKAHVVREIGSIARPDDVHFADVLPKTRSGKIMRRLLREIAAGGKVSGDTTTLEDLSSLEKLRTTDEG